MTWQAVCTAAKHKYLNMSSTGEWSAVNPADAQLLALATQIEELKRQNATLATKTPGTASGKQETPGLDRTLTGGVQKWRTTKKGSSLVVDGKTFYWCPHHKHPKGFFDGLYCLHKPENHDEWKAKYKKNRPAPGTNAPGNSTPPPPILTNSRLISASARCSAPSSCCPTTTPTISASKSLRKTRGPGARWMLA